MTRGGLLVRGPVQIRGPLISDVALTGLSDWSVFAGSPDYDRNSDTWTFSVGDTIQSPMYYFRDYPGFSVSAEFLTSTTSNEPTFQPEGGTLMSALYYKADLVSAALNSAGFTSNGNAQVLVKNQWGVKAWTMLNGSGNEVYWARFRVSADATYVNAGTDTFKVRGLLVKGTSTANPSYYPHPRNQMPRDLPGLYAWYDFSDWATLYQNTARTTSVTADSQVLQAIVDKSDNGRHLTEATNPPTVKTAQLPGDVSRPVARFDGTNDILSVSGLTGLGGTDQPLSIFAVAKNTGSGSNRQVIAGVDSSSSANPLRNLQLDNSGSRVIEDARDDGGTNKAAIGTAMTADGKFHLLGFVDTGLVSNVYLDGTRVGTANQDTDIGATTVDQISVGGSKRNQSSPFTQLFTGDLAELVIIDGTLTDDQIRYAVEPYFQQKYGVAV